MLVHPPMTQSQLLPVLHHNPYDQPFASPADGPWDSHRPYSADAADLVTWNYYTLPPSPPTSVSSNAGDSPELSTKTVRPPISPESPSDSDQQPCLPTSQVFDLDGLGIPSSRSSASPPPSVHCQLTLSSSDGPPLKKSFASTGVKKGRGGGERITTKDFVPPDVTGLSKREARLLKNRAAAFLSRQRKREEFEAMEIRVKEFEEENSRLQALAEKGKKYDDLLQNMEHLRLRLSMAEKRERELTVELASRTAAANVAVKTESQDLGLPPPSYPAYTSMGQSSIISLMKQSLLSSLPSLLSMPPQISLPITFSIPLTGTGSARPPSSPFSHQPTPCDIKDHGQPQFGFPSVGFHPNPVDVDSSKKMVIGSEPPEARQFGIDGHHCLGSLLISFDVSPTEDGRGCVRVHVSEGSLKGAMHKSRQRSSSLASWPVADAPMAATCYGSPPLSAPTIPSSGSIDHLGVFAGTGNAHPRMGFDTQLMQSGYTPFAQYDPEQTFDYCPGLHLE